MQRNTHRPTTTTEANDNTSRATTATILYIKGISAWEHLTHPTTIQYPRRSQTYHHTTSVTDLNVKDKDEPGNRQRAVYKINCSDCHASYIGETGRNLTTRLTEHKRATRKGDVTNYVAKRHRRTNHTIDWDSA